ncbi:MAG: hypothetical protein L6428_15605 [Candidatus Aminicenantes bacterium]|nr:hypothetical protein [Candidatus Aminicenantes bacterium]
MDQERQSFRGLKWKFALVALVCFVVLTCGGAYMYGRQLTVSNDLPRPGLVQSHQAYAANFCLSPFQINTDSVNGGGSESLVFSPQQQPFNELPVRVRLLDDDPEYNKKSPLWAVALKVVVTNVFVWAVCCGSISGKRRGRRITILSTRLSAAHYLAKSFTD